LFGKVPEWQDIDAVPGSQNRSAGVNNYLSLNAFERCHGTQALTPGIGKRKTGFCLNRDQVRIPDQDEIDFKENVLKRLKAG